MAKVFMYLCGLIFSSAALADTSDILLSNNQFGIKLISTNVDYTETGNGIYGTQTGVLDTETGPVRGFALSVSSMKGAGNSFIQADVDISNGNTKYTGAFQGGVFGSVITTSTAKLINFNVRFGKGFPILDQFMLTPYAGFGHHEWDRGVNYGETYTHFYYGIGLLGQYSPASNVVLSADALLGGTLGSYITVDSGPGFGGFSGALGDSVLSRLGLSADYAFTKQLHGNIGFDYTKFSYGMSAVYPVGGNFVAWEPDSKTNYTTFKIGMGFVF